jgi:hypothetical protein
MADISTNELLYLKITITPSWHDIMQNLKFIATNKVLGILQYKQYTPKTGTRV